MEQLTTPHREVRVFPLTSGLVFLGVAGIWAAHASGMIKSESLGWVFPAVLVAAGVIALLAMLLSGGNRRRADRAAQVSQPEPDAEPAAGPDAEPVASEAAD